MRSKMGCLGLFFKGAISLILIMGWVWGCFALYLSGPEPEWLRLTLTCLFGMFLPLSFFLSRSFVRGLVLCILLFSALIVWWQTLQPTNNKDWSADVARISNGKIQGNNLTMHNVRNFRYTDDKIFAEHWETREYNLDKLQGLDLFLSYWASDHIAHTIMSWDFGYDQHLAISIETRKDKTQEYSAIKGFFKQFELSYVAADERDIISLRTNYRKERVYAYRLNVSNEQARNLLESYIAEMNRLVEEPEFYNALTRNCTTTIHLHATAVEPDAPGRYDWRLLASGHFDKLLYAHGILNNDLPFEELRQKSRIDLRMQLLKVDHFPRLLRENLQ